MIAGVSTATAISILMMLFVPESRIFTLVYVSGVWGVYIIYLVIVHWIKTKRCRRNRYYKTSAPINTTLRFKL